MKDLTGKIVVITGGGSGIGRATALLLASRGATVAVGDVLKSRAARPPEDVASAIVDGITKNKSRVLVGTDTKAIDKIVRLVPGSYPRIMAPMLRKLLDKTLNS